MLVFLFFALFILILIESIYFLKKNAALQTNADIQTSDIGNQDNTKSKFVLFFFLLLFLSIGISLFFTLKNRNMSQTQVSITPTPFPARIISPSLSPALLQTGTPQPTPLSFITPISSGTATRTKTPNPTLSKKPTPTLRPSSTPKPSPTKKAQASPTVFPIGNPVTEADNQEATPSKGIVIVPKLPVAGSTQQTVLYLFSALGIIILGILL